MEDRYSQPLNSAVDEILFSSRPLLRNAGGKVGRRLNELYPSHSQVTTNLAETSNTKGKNRVTGTSTNLGSVSNFTISNGGLIQNLALHVTIKIAGRRLVQHGFLFQAIKSLTITFANSFVQNLTLSGPSMREYLLYTCTDSKMRTELLDQAGLPNTSSAGEVTLSASIPIGIFLLSAVGLKGVFPIDTNTLTGPININVTYASAGAFTGVDSGGGVTPDFPTKFESAVMTMDMSQIVDSQFAMSSSLAARPGSAYSIPYHYTQDNIINIPTFSPSVGGEKDLTLLAVPSGILQAIIFIIKPFSDLNTTATTAIAKYNPVGGSVNLKYLRLRFGAEDLFLAESASEIRNHYRSAFGGDLLSYKTRNHQYTAGTGLIADIGEYDGNVICVPFGYDMCKVARGPLTENGASFGAANLSVRIAIDPVNNRTAYVKGDPFKSVSEPVEPYAVAASTQWQLEVLYIMASAIVISGGVVDLNL